MQNSKIRPVEALVDAVVVGMCNSDEDDLFEAFVNRPHGAFSESICGDEFEKQKLSKRDELQQRLESRLDTDGKQILSEYAEVVEDYWSELGRSFFNLGVRLGRVFERQREAERMLTDLEMRKRRKPEKHGRGAVMNREQKELAYDEEEILNASKRIVGRALQPQALAVYVLDFADDEGREDLEALRTAIDSRYPEFRERFEGGERGDVETELTVIDELLKFHIGVAVGRRVK